MTKLEILQALERREIDVRQAKRLLADLRANAGALASDASVLLTLSCSQQRLEPAALSYPAAMVLISDLTAGTRCDSALAGVQWTIPFAAPDSENLPLADCDAVLLLLGADCADECQEKLQSAFQWLGALRRHPGKRVLFACHGRFHLSLSQGIAGLVQVMRAEHPACVISVIHTESPDVETALRALRALAGLDVGAYFELSLVDRTCYRPVLVENLQSAPISRVGLRQNGVYLITGGAGGIGLQIARHLKHSYGARLVLAGRSPLDERLRRSLDDAQLSCDYFSVDVADDAQVAGLMAQIGALHGELHGVIHAAGVLDDSYFIRQDVSRFAGVLAPKLLGAHRLDLHSRRFDLDFFALCSSMATSLPNTGQAAYAAANRAMSAMTALRCAAGAPGRTVALHWPLWDGGSMGLSAQEKAAQAEAFGIYPMPVATGMQTLEAMLASGETQRWYLFGERPKLERLLAGVAQPVAQSLPVDVAAPDGIGSIVEFLVTAIAQATETAREKIHPDQTFDAYGLDSLMINRLNVELATQFQGVAKTVFFEYPSIRALAQHLLVQPRQVPKPAAQDSSLAEPVHSSSAQAWEQRSCTRRPTPLEQDIAIVGVAGRYPDAANIAALAARLRAGADCIGEIPAARWPLVGFSTDDAHASLTAGGYLDDVEMFDPYFFGISPRDAENIDPQERLFLQTVWHALENGGYSVEKLHARSLRHDALGQPRHRVGVYAGIAAGQYSLLVARDHQPGEAVCAQSSSWSVANRVSYFLDLHGPSLSIDSACSSSLSALDIACTALRNDDIAVAIVGGISLNLDPLRNRVLEAAHMLSADRRCRSFGAGGTGFVPGEGVAALVLRRLGDAQRDRDNVLGVIKACRLNHGGRTNGYTVPSPVAHASLIAETLAEAGVSAADVSYVEAHGTGTQLGDPIELAGLGRAFGLGAGHTTQSPCAIGSIKSNIGHLEPAAALAGLTKILLQFESATIFPSLHSRTLNPALDIDKTHFFVPQAATDWIAGPAGRRIAVLSSFGAGGSNGHVILEHRDRVEDPHTVAASPPAGAQLFLFSAMTRGRLDALVQTYIQWLQSGKTQASLPPPENLATLLRTARASLDCRLAVIAQGYDELLAVLCSFIRQETHQAWRYHCMSERPLTVQAAMPAEQMLALIRRAAWSTLADSWLDNRSIPWHEEPATRVIALPLYPFESKRCWFHDNKAMSRQAPTAPEAPVARYPIGHRIERPAAGDARVVFHLDATEPMVGEHRFNSHVIVAGTLQLELVRAATALLGTFAVGTPLSFRDVIYASVLNVDQAVDVTVTLTTHERGQFAFEVAAQGTHARGFVAPAPPDAAQAGQATATSGDRMQSMAGAELYRLFAQAGYAYGELYCGIESATFGADGCLATIRQADPLADGARRYQPMLFHPAIVDAGLQSIALMNTRAGHQFLPFSCAEIRVQRPAEHIVRSVAVRRAGSSADEQRFDIRLLDRHDRECIAYLDFCARATSSASSVTAGGTNLYRPLWQVHALPSARPEPEPAGFTLVLAPPHPSLLLDALIEALGKDNVRRLDISASQDWSHIKDALHDAGSRRVRLLHCVGLSDSAAAQRDGSDVDGALDRNALYSLFDLSKLLFGLSDARVELTVVTDDVFQLEGGENFNLASSSLAGFARSLSRELVGAKVALLDFDSADIAARAPAARREYLGKWLRADLPSLPHSAVAIRHDVAHTESFAPVARTHIGNADALKARGTYLIVGGSGGLGSATAAFLAEQYSATVILVGRRSTPRGLIELQEPGCGRILHYRADITSTKDVLKLARDIESDYGRIDGVFHSAVVLRDVSVRQMSREALDEVLAPKTAGVVNFFRYLAPLCRDLVVLYSSAISQNGTEGQANYAAASAFEDAYARAMIHTFRQRDDAPKIVLINWGFWREVGIVATSKYVGAFARKGIAGLSTAEGMALLQLAVNGDFSQVVTGSDDVLTAASTSPLRAPDTARRSFESSLERFWKKLDVQNIDLGAGEGIRDELQTCVEELLLVTLRDAGLFLQQTRIWPVAEVIGQLCVVPDYQALLQACMAILVGAGRLDQVDGGVSLSARPVASRAQVETRIEQLAQAHADTAPILTLFRRCMDHLAAVMGGRMSYAEVLFPRGSDRLVAPLYRDNPASDLFNRVIRHGLEAYLRAEAHCPRGRPVRVLEIGAGTGGTTRLLLDALTRGEPAVEYVFTDISSSFVNAGRERFGPQAARMSFAVLDIEDEASQRQLRNQFDVVIATNVLHATRSIGQVLQHCRSLLRDGGVLMLNEACERKDIMTLTFGLSSGWWTFEDPAQRIEHSPLLKPERWSHLLRHAGFTDIQFIGDSPHSDAFGHFACFAWAGHGDGAQAVTESARPDSSPAAVQSGVPSASVDIAHSADEVAIAGVIRQHLSELQRIPPDELGDHVSFNRYGVDSIVSLQLLDRLRVRCPALSNEAVIRHNTIASLARHMAAITAGEVADGRSHHAQESGVSRDAESAGAVAAGEGAMLPPEVSSEAYPAHRPVRAASPPDFGEPSTQVGEIAIIGISGRYPGAADIDTFWANLVAGHSAFGPTPTDRWPASAPLAAGMLSGGYLDRIDCFDSLFFHVSPRDAQRMDPQERLLIETCWLAVEDAGYTPAGLDTTDTQNGVGVFAATMYGHYELLAADEWAKNHPASASSAHYALANNVSRLMNFTGPSVTVDSACSSALTALHLAVMHLRSGDCAVALVGGVNLVLHPSHLASLDAMKMLSPSGQCRVFAADADGFLVGEGVGAMVIKPLAAARADGDHIYAVVKAVASNANGSTATAVPSAAAQAAVIRRALDKAGLSADCIDYIELQSTGSRLGDKAEIDALGRVFGTAESRRDRPLWLGSVKPGIGHLEAAAGMAQLTKAVLQLRWGRLAKTIADFAPEPEANYFGPNLQLVRETRDWPFTPARPRRAGISSFGAGGSNVHVIIEDYMAQARTAPCRGLLLFPLSARKPAILRRYADRMAQYFSNHPDLSVAEVAFTAQVGRVAQRFRLCLAFSDLTDLRGKLAEFAGSGAIRDGFSGEVEESASRAAAEAEPHSEAPPAALARRWVSGGEVDWLAMYAGEFPGRLALPGYPFEEVRHWFEKAEPRPVAAVYPMQNDQKGTGDGATRIMTNAAATPVTAVDDRTITLADIQTLVCGQIGEVLKIDQADIHPEGPLSEYGFDSITLTELVARFAEPYGIDIDVTVFFEHTTVQQFANFLFEHHAAKISALHVPAAVTSPASAVKELPAAAPGGACLLTEEDVLRIAAGAERDSALGAGGGNAAAPTLEDIQSLVVREVCSVLSIDAKEIRIEGPLSEYGFDSISLSELVARFAEPYDIDIDVTIFFEHTTLGSFARYLFESHAGRLAGAAGGQVAADGAVISVASHAPVKTAPPALHDPVQLVFPQASAPVRGADSPLAGGPGLSLSLDLLREFLAEQVSDLLKIDRLEIRMDMPMRELGFDAVNSSELLRRLNLPQDIGIDVRSFISHPSLGSFAQQLFDRHVLALRDFGEKRGADQAGAASRVVEQRAQVAPAAVTAPAAITVRDKDVAVIGMAGQFPGSTDLESFWQNLCEGQTSITGFPTRRTEEFTLYAARQAYPEFDYFFRGGFLDDFDKFDPLFFKISPVEARTIDPQQRLLLECAWQTIEDAGYNPRALSGSLTGVFVGVATSEYADILTLLAKDDQARDFTGTLFSAHANRISFNLDLHGPSEAIDTACSSSLVAAHRAVQSLRSGECQLALAGGVNIILGCAAFLMFGAAGMLARDGRCKSFDDKADGYVRGEGVGFVLLKPLAKAIEDGDNIRAVIKGTAIRHGGRAASMTSPGVVSQASLIRQSLDDAELGTETIGYIEAHGTGTRIGDPIEINALRRVFTDSTAARCAIGTVKANIGHLETAAGIAGLIKTILVLERGVIPPLATLDTVNSMIKLEDSRLYLPREKLSWQTGSELPRTAGVSSFGIGGVIVHQVLQQGSCFQRNTTAGARAATYPVVLSAQSRAQLKRYCTALLKRITSDETLQLHDVALTLARGREAFPHRVAMLATSRPQLLNQLIGFITDEPSSDVVSGHAERTNASTPVSAALTSDSPRAAAETWVRGGPASWDSLFAGMSYRKASLPSYPFERESVWVPGKVILVTEEEAALRRAQREPARPAPAAPGPVATQPPQQDTANVSADKSRTEVASPPALHAVDVKQAVLENIARVFSETMHIPMEKLNPTSQFADFGVDSLSGLRIMQRLQQEYGSELPAAAVLENPTLLDLAGFIAESIVAADRGDVSVAAEAHAPQPAANPTPDPAAQTNVPASMANPGAKPASRPRVSVLNIKPGLAQYPLVILCGPSGDLTWCMHWIDTLAEGQRVIGIELAGFGDANAREPVAFENLSTLARELAEPLRDIDCGDGFRLVAYSSMATVAAQLCDLPVIGNRLHEVILVDPQPGASVDMPQLFEMYACAWGADAAPEAQVSAIAARARSGEQPAVLVSAMGALLTQHGRVPMPANMLDAWLTRAAGNLAQLNALLAATLIKPAPYAGAMTVIESSLSPSDYVAQAWPVAEANYRQIDLERRMLVSRSAPHRPRSRVETKASTGTQHLRPGLVTLNGTGRQGNIVCFPTLYGDAGYATSLSLHLGRDYSMYALEQWLGARALTYPTIETLAGAFADQLLSSPVAAPYTLLGLSFGGVVAYEVCHQLQRAGHPVENLILIDPYMPNTDAFSVFGEMRLEVDGKDLNQIGLAGIIFDRWRVNQVLDFELLNNLAEEDQIEVMARHLAAHSSAKLSFTAARRVIASHFAVDKANRHANTRYHPGALPRDVNTLMIMASQGFYNPAVYEGQRGAHHYEAKEEQIIGLSSDPTKGFRPFLKGEFRLIEFACDHLSMPMHLRECATAIDRFLGDTRAAAATRKLVPSVRGTQGVAYEI
ncbi:SDR family NAD(P)-dependent oxidoreductase [Tahibacter sp.]|uniref:SDR family NAD(P)-dependent oxidoreductase n=1 Tax=Tahibacter sp. TaxID=2056211 RepID=UPI0028C4A58F|nr:SDR family NAD(P)-dependent oxidoreductase [Tahibacter sp.]